MSANQQPSAAQPPDQVDLAIVTALPEELEPVLGLIGGPDRWERFTLARHLFYKGRFDCGPRPFSVVACSLPRMGGSSTTVQVLHLEKLRPRLIVMTGICAGWQERGISLGDLVVADRAFQGGEGKLTAAGFQPDILTYQSPPWLLGFLKDFATDAQWAKTIATPRPRSLRYQAEWLLCQLAAQAVAFPPSAEAWELLRRDGIEFVRAKQALLDNKLVSKTGKPTRAGEQRLNALREQNNGVLAPQPDPERPRVHYKAFVSTEAVVAVPDPFTTLAKPVRGLGALELEVAALLSAALELGVPAFAVKGVSDYGTPDKDDAFHAYAAEAAARWMHAFICRYAALLDGALPNPPSAVPQPTPQLTPSAPAPGGNVSDDIIGQKKRRLHGLRLTQARYGINTPVEVTLEIEDLVAEIAQLEREAAPGAASEPVKLGGRAAQIQRASLERQLSSLEEEYKAADQQRNSTLDAAQRVQLQRKLDDLAQEIQRVDDRLQQL